MNVSVSFPGGVAVQATIGGHAVLTDQPQPLGGDTAMSPFELLFASIATCMGFYALRFCQERAISSEGLGLSIDAIRSEDKKRVVRVEVNLALPPDFPDKYKDAIRRAVDHCAVKRAMMEPPEFVLQLTEPATLVAT
jgi:ribosomal protein S12 methylthiotransferase accessory factor